MQNVIIKRVENVIRHNSINDQKVIIGLSGGVDSTVLLNIVSSLKSKYNIDLFAVHVHHGLREFEADRDALFCREMCQNLNIPLDISYVDVKQTAQRDKTSIELAARNERKKHFKSKATEIGARFVFLAHTLDDQIETILFRLGRGTGLHGITGIKECSNDANISILRPLLKVKKNDIINFAREYKYKWVEDSSNRELDFTRNQIRHKLIPVFQEIFENAFPDSILRFSELSSAILKEFQLLVDEKIQDDWMVFDKIIVVDLKRVESLTLHSFAERLRLALLESELYSYLPSFELTKKIYELCLKDTGKKIQIFPNIWVYKDRSFVVFKQDKDIYDYKPLITINTEGETNLPFKEGAHEFYKHIFQKKYVKLSYAFSDEYKIDDISWRYISHEDINKYKINNKCFKELFLDKNVPKFIIPFIPVIFCGDTPVLIPGVQGKRGFITDNGNQINFEFNK